MQCFTELVPPTAATHSLTLPFTSGTATNLIVAKTSLLQIFSVKTITVGLEAASGDNEGAEDAIINSRQLGGDEDGFESSFLDPDAVQRSTLVSTTKLVLVGEYALAGTITSLARIKIPESKSGGEFLLLSFKDAKLSLVEWDPERYGLSTVSIHYYEQEEIGGSPWDPYLSDCFNYLTADPRGRCAALKFGARNLAILPFRQGDEDTEMDDWDEELDGPRPTTAMVTNENKGHEDTPYAPSFVLRLSSLDPTLIHTVHLAFLYEYREPTFGILSSTLSPSSSLLDERKDQLSYMVFTLDLNQKASTTILVVTGLPYDLFKVIPLQSPVGGALLVGGNELIHIDQSGKANGVAVNALAKSCTAFGLVDQSSLEIRLEGCAVEQLSADNGEMLIILNTGELAVLSFRMDGRSVSGLDLRRVPSEAGISMGAQASCTSLINHNSMFIGSEDSDSIVLGWSRKSKQIGRRRSQPNIDAGVDADVDGTDEDQEDEDEDDLYGESTAAIPLKGEVAGDSNSKAGDYAFRIHDSLVNIAPLRDVTLSKPESRPCDENKEASSSTRRNIELVGIAGRNTSGSLAFLKREIEPNVIGRFEFPEARGIWTLCAKRPSTKALEPENPKSTLDAEAELGAQFDRLMIVSKSTEETPEESSVYVLTSAGFEDLTDTEFEPAAGATIECGTIGNGMRVVQILKSEVRSYDGDLGLAQILPMFDDETGAEPKIVAASIIDPYILLIRDDASIYVASCDSDNDLEEIEREDDSILTNKWLSGCLYNDSTGRFAETGSTNGTASEKSVIMSLLNAEGALFMYALPDMSKPIYQANGVSFIPTTISPDYAARRSTVSETLTEVLLADLGDATSKSPYLIFRASNDDLTIYEPFRVPSEAPRPLSKSLHFQKIHNPHLAKTANPATEVAADPESAKRDSPMRAISNVGGLSGVFLPGDSPSFVLKSSKSIPRVVGLRGNGVRSLSGFHTEGCDRGFIYVDSKGIARVSQLEPETNVTDLGLTVQKVKIGEEIQAVTYHPPKDVYVIGTTIKEPFELPKDDDYHREWAKEDITFKPLTGRGFLKLLSPSNWSIIDEVELDPHEIIMCIKTLNLEVSENTHERKQLITVGTAISKGEDLAIRGRVYVYEVITVVPFPDRPETNKKLKLIAKEEIPRGAITGISEIGTQGFMIVAQGQKSMVRGLKEDGTLLPVAFVDMNTYVTTIKSLPGTGMCLFADAIKGVWFAGYSEEPYKMTIFGKQSQAMEVVAADLLPIGDELYIIVADLDCNLHVLQFDPEHPKSLHGQLLLQRTTFSLGGHMPTTMTLLPLTTPAVTPKPSEPTNPTSGLLITLASGAIGVLTPLSEQQYRRLNALSNHLSNLLYHPAGLNPKAYRISSTAPETVIGGRQIVDGSSVWRWLELGSQKRAEVAGRVGVDGETVREDLEEIAGGLGYL
ncbi:hypothetical protein V496_07618 [Pseudogymnoascus sp. VKM F-4515 (FW-2607)]|nr:hypothetical protein V496_07618 [Pseudogymnoascus sp. VKM F-4515 (FW-2607)]